MADNTYINFDFDGQTIPVPVQTMGGEAHTPDLMVQVGSGDNAVTSSTLTDWENFSVTHHMEYEIARKVNFDAAKQLHTASQTCISDVKFIMSSETPTADIFNLMVNGTPVDQITFAEIQNTNGDNVPREVTTFMNCYITAVKRINSSWGNEKRSNLLMVEFRATAWQVDITAKGQDAADIGKASANFDATTGTPIAS